MRTACAILLLALLSGCTKYEYNLVKPEALSRHIGSNVDAVVTVDPLEYRMLSVDSRLVMRIFNPSSDAIELLGAKSTVVDPEGQSHPLKAQTIAPNSFIKLILPPPRPRVYDSGPNFGFGVGVGTRVDSRYRSYDPYAYDYQPRYLAVVDENDTTYWDWKGEGESRIVLVFSRGGKEFTNEFLFRRQKM